MFLTGLIFLVATFLYVLSFEKAGTINAAIAIMNGELIIDDKDPLAPGTFTDNANTIGLSMGAGYSIPLSNNAGLAFKANYQFYNFDEYDALAGLTTTESILAIDISYYATF